MASHRRKRPKAQHSPPEREKPTAKHIREEKREREAVQRAQGAERARRYREKKKAELDKS